MADESEKEHTKSEAKIDRRVMRTQTAIHEAFFKLIKEQGLNKVTVSSLAREANIDRKTFYLHYESIDDLIDQIMSEFISRILAVVDVDAMFREPHVQIRTALEEVNAVIMENMNLCEYIASNLSLDFSMGHIRNALIKITGGQSFQETGWEQERLVYLLRFNLVGAVSVYVAWLRSDRHTSLETIADLLADALTIGFVSTVTSEDEGQ